MASTQHKLDRIRPPRVQITYDVEIGGALKAYELSFVMGILADLAGKPATPLPPLKERDFIEIDRDNFNDVMASLNAQLPLRVKNVLGGNAPDHNLLLSFRSMDDFNPSNIVGQVEFLGEEYKKRVALTDLLSKLDGNDALDEELRNIIENPEVLNQLQRELNLKK
jgi:type VI secretion system protein ImpB